MVIKSGRFGRFLACPGYPDCTFTKPIVIEMPGKCPLCGSRILKKTSKRGFAYYGCEKNPTCSFMTWDVPTAEVCPECGQTMFKRAGRGNLKPFCINEACPNFLPEDKRGYRKKKTAEGQETAETASSQPEEKQGTKTAAKKAPAKKTPAKKTGTKKTTAKKSTKTTVRKKKPAEEEPAAAPETV